MMYGWTGMEGFGLVHWLTFVVMVAAVLYPIGKIIARVGLSPFWSILALVPLINLIALWVFAFSEWPGDSAKRGS